jgi:hypothetical protein
MPQPKRLHLDKRASRLAAEPGADDELLDTAATVRWLAVSVGWLELSRVYGYGPPYEKMGPRLVRYHRGRVREWLRERERTRTSDRACA